METSVSGGDDPYVGLVLDGQFRLEAQAGSGSMARVFRARHLAIEREVAVKILRRELLGQAEVVTRFKREARIAARLEHPNIVVVHAVGELPVVGSAVGGEPFVVLELLVGPSLSTLLAENGGTLPMTRALHIVLALCDALGEAHAHGIVHRDVKPENVMLVRRGGDSDFVKVLDFGLAKTLDEHADLRTRAGAVLGTPSYLSPEGAEGRAISPASDCYSVATVLYQCLAGRTPFDADNAVAILVQQATAQAPDLRSFDAARSVPRPIAEVVMQNLAKRASDRAQDARALGRALVTAARSAGIDVEQIGLSSTLLGSTRRAFSNAARDVRGQRAIEASEGVSAPTAWPPAAAPVAAPVAEERPSRSARRPRSPWLIRRIALFVACFMLGVAAALGIASAFGAFNRTGG